MDEASQIVNVLMVDDRPENLLALAAVLASPNYNLVSVRSGEEALKQVLMENYAVILMDVQMPGLDGFETAKLIKSRDKSKHIPIIFITAISQAGEHVNYGYSVGAVDYIFKPFHPETLKMKIEAFVKLHLYHEQIKRLEEERRKQNEELEKMVEKRTRELSDSNERFRKIFNNSPSMIAIRSLTDMRYIDVNKSWLKLSGYRYEEVLNSRHNLLRIEESGITKLGNIYKRLSEMPIRNIKITFMDNAGNKREGLLSTEFIELKGEPCILGVIVDVTERQLLEKEMARLDRLNLVGEMAAGIAHEIRNPMTTVRGFLQLSKNHPSPDYVDLMLDELDRANSIITEFLTLAKNRASQRMMKQLNSIIEGLFPLIQAEAILAGKDIELELGDCPQLFLDEKEICQMVLNLALNGLQAMQNGGKLTLQTYSQEKEVILVVRDQGCGIKDDLLDKLGTPFFTTKEKGTGLGLAVCYSVAVRHDAVIDVETGEWGTQFNVKFRAETGMPVVDLVQ